MPDIGQYLPHIQSDAGRGEDAGKFGLGDEGDNHGGARGMGGDGVVDRSLGVNGKEIRRASYVVDGSGDGTCAGTGKVGGVRMYPQDHIGSPIDLAGIGMGGDAANKTIDARHGGEGRGYLFTGEGTGGGEPSMRLSTLRP
jgi:hypothetical protein